MDIGSKTTSSNKMFPRYTGPVSKIPSNGMPRSNRPTSIFSVVKLPREAQVTDNTTPTAPKYRGNHLSSTSPVRLGEATIPKESDKLPSFLDPKWNEVIDEPKSVSHVVPNLSEFWFENPSTLFQNLDVIPQSDMNDAQRLNAMTRVIIIITAIMFAVQFPLWWLFLTLGLIIVIAMWYLIKGREYVYAESSRRQREYLRPRPIVRPINPIIRPVQFQPNVQTQKLNIVSLV